MHINSALLAGGCRGVSCAAAVLCDALLCPYTVVCTRTRNAQAVIADLVDLHEKTNVPLPYDEVIDVSDIKRVKAKA